MEQKIRELEEQILNDVGELRKSDSGIEQRLPVEIMALNAVVNAEDKILKTQGAIRN